MLRKRARSVRRGEVEKGLSSDTTWSVPGRSENQRHLVGPLPYIYNDEGCKMPILAVIGIAQTGERDVLAFRVGDRENQPAWEDLLEDLKDRGVKTVGLWGSRWQQGDAGCSR
jgi:hypothetical protein